MTVSMYKVSVPIFMQFLAARAPARIDKAVGAYRGEATRPNLFFSV